jgi:hypothetical protein
MDTKKVPRNMGFLQFWLESLKRSFTLGWFVFGVVSTAMPAAITLIQHWYPALAAHQFFKSVSEYQAEIQVAIALVVLASYAAYAPFRLYKEVSDDATDRIRGAEKSVEKLETTQKEILKTSDRRYDEERVKKYKLEQQIGELQLQLDRRAECRKMAFRIGHVMEKGRQLLRGYVDGTSDWDALNNWTANDVNPILTELGIIYIARFNAAPQTITGISVVGIPDHLTQSYLMQASRMKVLEDFIKELKPPL